MKPIIRVENLGKQYLLGGPQEPYGTVREALVKAARAPFAYLQSKPGARQQIWALRDVDFSIAPGEVVGVIGRNGAGKSTLLKILSRITEPTRGRVELYGRVGSLLEVGTGFHPELTGRENIYLNGAILGMRRHEITRAFDRIVAFAEVEKFLDTPVKHYSSGMYMRLAFSVAAHLEPEILLMDEVLAVGDAAFQKKCLGKMGEVARDGRTVLLVSHNISAVQSFCTSAMLLSDGQLKSSGAVSEVVGEYLRETDTASAATLLARSKRSGSGGARFVDAQITMPDAPAELPFSGAPLRIALTLENHTGQPLHDIDVSFSLHDRFEGDLAGVYSSYMGRYFTLAPGRNVVSFILRSPLLLGGPYFLALRATHSGLELDWPRVKLPFEIVEDDFYGHGTANWRDWRGAALVDGYWEQENIALAGSAAS